MERYRRVMPRRPKRPYGVIALFKPEDETVAVSLRIIKTGMPPVLRCKPLGGMTVGDMVAYDAVRVFGSLNMFNERSQRPRGRVIP